MRVAFVRVRIVLAFRGVEVARAEKRLGERFRVEDGGRFVRRDGRCAHNVAV